MVRRTRIELWGVVSLAVALQLAAAAQDRPAASSLKEAIKAAEGKRPILAVAGSEACPFCRELDKEMQKEEVTSELSRWVVAKFDADRSPEDALALAVRAIPALRILTPAGKVVVAREGALPASELVGWLKEHFEAASAPLPAELTASGELTALQAVRLARELARRDPIAREAAIRRLSSNPAMAAPPVAAALVEGSLATRLAALEVLKTWKAPVEGLDPWRPETITQQRLEALSAWAANPQVDAATESIAALSESLAAAVKDAIRRMLTAPPAEAQAIRERLARHGRLLLPVVYEQLAAVQTDEARQRLTALRYRLVATDELALTWPGGIERLAAGDARVRHQAMDELAARASAADEALLLELFSDPEPLVRELALAALYKTGGDKANSALVRLLDDPDPNVQVAVLKQLAEAPAHSALARLRTYLEKQPDADLLVHAVRVLRKAKSKAAVESLVGLLSHENWRVRSEAVEAIGEAVGGYDAAIADEDKADAYVTLVDLLQDEDAFVVSRAVQVLGKANLAIAVNPLAQVAERHPELAVEVVKALAHSGAAQLKVADHLRRFASHDDAKVRAAAIKGLCEVNPEDLDAELARALADRESGVRISAAEGLFDMMNVVLQQQRFEALQAESMAGGSLVQRGLAALGNFLGGGRSPAGGSAVGVTADAVSEEEPIKLPSWMKEQTPALRAMLHSESAAERFTAALPLVALGDEAGLPVITVSVNEDTGRAGAAAAALPWLPWDQRQAFFVLLTSKARNSEQLAAMATELTKRPQRAAAAMIWGLLAREDADAQLVNSLIYALRTMYLGDRWYDLDSIPKNQLAEAVKGVRGWAEAGTRWQRLAALSLLVLMDLSVAEEVATKLADDGALDGKLRESAFRVRLYAAEDDAAQEAAIAAIGAGRGERMKPALALLARGREALQANEAEGLQLSAFGRMAYGQAASQEPIPVVPAGISAEILRPILQSSDGQVRADAAYLLCLLGEGEGLKPLIEQWRALGKGDEELRRMVYRGISALDDASQTPVLVEIYQALAAEELAEHEVAAFYWTIRSMTGPDVLALRKRIRDEFGADSLQRNNPFGQAFRGSPL